MVQFTNYSEAESQIQQSAIQLLRDNFYKNKAYQDVESDITGSISSGGQVVKCIIENSELAAVTTYKIFDWNRLKRQLFLETRAIDKTITQLKLTPFEELLKPLKTETSSDKIVELSYTAVVDKYRGQGLQSQAFAERIREISQTLDDTIIFTTAMSDFQATDANSKLTRYMLNVEENKHGKNTDGTVNVQGAWVDIVEIEKYIGMTITPLFVDFGSAQTVHLAKKFGLVYAGMSRNLSSVYVATTADIHLSA